MRLVQTTILPLEALRPWPRAANLFPRFTEEQCAELAAFRKMRGDDAVLPIVTNQDYFIIDGYNRYTAAVKAGEHDISAQVFAYQDEREQELHAIVLNAKRRHLDAVHMARIALRLTELTRPDAETLAEIKRRVGRIGGRGRKRQTLSDGGTKRKRGDCALDRAARQLQVAPNTVRCVRRVDTSGDALLVSAMEARTISVSTAAEIAALPQDQRGAAIRAAQQQAAEMQALIVDLRKLDCSPFLAACYESRMRLLKAADKTHFAELSADQLQKCSAALGSLVLALQEVSKRIGGN